MSLHRCDMKGGHSRGFGRKLSDPQAVNDISVFEPVFQWSLNKL